MPPVVSEAQERATSEKRDGDPGGSRVVIIVCIKVNSVLSLVSFRGELLGASAEVDFFAGERLVVAGSRRHPLDLLALRLSF